MLDVDTAAAAEWLVHDHSGWLAPVGDTRACVTCARELAEHPERIAMARAQARGQVVQLDWQQSAAQVETVFLEVMSRHASHAPCGRTVPAF